MSTQIDARPHTLALTSFYDAASKLADPIVRLAAGGVLFVHGLNKLMTGPGPVIASMVKNGIEPAAPVAYWIMFLETVGAIAIILGLFTRFFAICLAIEMAVIAFAVQFPHGFSAPKGGYEMTLMWSLIFLSIALRGGGNYSVDKKIGAPW